MVVDPTGSKQTFTGTVDTAGVQLTSVAWTAGTNVQHLSGATVVDYFTATHISMITKGLLVSHNEDGTMITNLPLTTPKITTGIKDAAGNLIIPLLGSSSTSSIKLKTTAVGDTFVESGCIWSGDSYGGTRAGSLTAGVVYINGIRLTVAAVTAHLFTASKDTYIDFTNNGDGTALLTYVETTNNAASPALTTSGATLRSGIIVTGAGNIAAATSVNQGQETSILPIASSIPYAVTDSLGNLICPRDSQSKLLGYRQITSSATSSSTTATATNLQVPVIVPAGRKIKIGFYASGLTNSAAAGHAILLFDGAGVGGTQLQSANYDNYTASAHIPVYLEFYITPSSTTKTYSIGIISPSSGTATMSAGSTSPAFVKVELA